MVIWQPKSENTQEWSGKTSINKVKHLRNGLMRLEMCVKSTFVRWRDDRRSSSTVTTIGRQANSQQCCIQYSTTNTTRRPSRAKIIMWMRATHQTRKQGSLTQTWRTGLEAVPNPKIKPMDEQCPWTRLKMSTALIMNQALLFVTYRQRIGLQQARPPQDPNQGPSETPCNMYLSISWLG